MGGNLRRKKRVRERMRMSNHERKKITVGGTEVVVVPESQCPADKTMLPYQIDLEQFRRGWNKHEVYTANQPLCMGGQLYMFNRYQACGSIVHMPDAQFSKGGHQSRIEVVDRAGKKQWVIFPLKDRYQKSIEQCLLHEPEKNIRKVMATLRQLYGGYENYRSREESLSWAMLSLIQGPGGRTWNEAGPYELTLAQLNCSMFEWVRKQLGLAIHQHWTTVLFPHGRLEHPSEWVAEMGRKIGALVYLGGGSAQAAYIRRED